MRACTCSQCRYGLTCVRIPGESRNAERRQETVLRAAGRRLRRRLRAGLVILCLGLNAGCGGPADELAARTERLAIWAHGGREAERRVLQAQVARFNAAQSAVRADLTLIPEGSYNGQVQAAALAGGLPDVLEFDGPYLYNYAWQGRLRPLDELLAPALRAKIGSFSPADGLRGFFSEVSYRNA